MTKGSKTEQRKTNGGGGDGGGGSVSGYPAVSVVVNSSISVTFLPPCGKVISPFTITTDLGNN